MGGRQLKIRKKNKLLNILTTILSEMLKEDESGEDRDFCRDPSEM